MFRSAENLRLAADMRALERIAAPWRAARRTWFTGGPDSIEARIAATDRVLTVARSGITSAHLALTVEATNARRELTAAQDRLTVDFLDDGARTAGALNWNGLEAPEGECLHCGQGIDFGQDPDLETCPSCDKHPIYTENPYGREGSRQAAEVTRPETVGGGVSPTIPGAIGKAIWEGSPMTGQEESAVFNPGPKKSAALRLAAAEFVASQNTTDRDELAYRAARAMTERTGQLPARAQEQAVRAFVAAVRTAAPEDQECEGCNAEAGEECRPWCTGKAKHDDEKADRKKGHRTAAILPDFDDQLLFGS